MTEDSQTALLVRADAYAQATIARPPGPPTPFLAEEEIADIAATETRLGIPRAVLLLGDALLRYIAPDKRATVPRRWIEAAVPGADLSGVTSAFLLWLLTDPLYGVLPHAQDTRVRRAIDAVADAHRRLLGGEMLARAQWAAVRKATLIDIAAETDGRLAFIAGGCAECAAWPPATSASVGAQTLQRWVTLADAIVDAEHGWTLDDYARLASVQSRVWAASKADREAGQQPDLDVMMLADDSVISRRWGPITTQRKGLIASRMDAAIDHFVALLRAAPGGR